MKYLKVFFLLFLIGSFSVQAQKNEIDSLKNLLTTKDTTRVTLLNKLAFRLIFSMPKSAEEYVMESIGLAEELKFYKGHAHAYQVLGTLLDVQGEYSKAISSHKKGLEILDHSNSKSEKVYLVLYNGLGLAYYHKGSYVEALEFFFKALALAEKANLIDLRTGNILSNIGLIYHDQKEYDNALKYYFKALKQGEKIENRTLIGRTANNIGTVYKDTDQYDKAIEYFLISLENKKNLSDSLGISATLANLGGLHNQLGNYTEALSYLDKAENLKLNLGDKMGLIIVNDTRVEIFIAQHKLKEAEELLHKNLAMAIKVGGENKILVYDRFHELCKAKGDYRNALKWYVRKTDYSDSLFNQTKSKQLAELQTLYEVNKREKEIVELEKEKEEARLTKSIMLISIVSLSVLIILIIYIVRYKIKQRQQLYKIERELHMKTIENAAFREGELNKVIEFKNKELTSYTINFVQKSELMEDLKRNLQAINQNDSEVGRKIAGLSKLVESSYQIDREWEDFKMQFGNVHQNFFQALKDRCPALTNGDLKLCALLKLNMNMKEASKVLAISPESIKTARYRLRKKFGLLQNENLVDFILSIGSEVKSKEEFEIPV